MNIFLKDKGNKQKNPGKQVMYTDHFFPTEIRVNSLGATVCTTHPRLISYVNSEPTFSLMELLQ